MRKLITAYLLEHTQHGENYLASLGDAALLKLYSETLITINSFETI